VVERGWLGVHIQSIDEDLAQSLGLASEEGALVAAVTDDSPAAKAGLERGDVIVSFDGKPVNEMRDLPRIVADTPVGSTVTVDVMREGKPQQLQVEIGRLEEGEKIAAAQTEGGPQTETKLLGMTIAPISEELRTKFKLKPDAAGAVVTEVEPDGPAAEKNIEPGDLITEAGERQVKSPVDVEGRVKELKDEGRSSILLLVLKTARNGDPHFVAVRLN
jgi:serine protease Do